MFSTKIMKMFNKRSGTTSNGTEFKNVHIANYVLQLVSNPKIEDFHLSSNEERYGAFDHIVVEIKYEHGKEIFAVQLAHEDKQTLDLGDIEMVRYFDSFQKCDDIARKFIFLTNLKFELEDNKPFQLEGEDLYVTLSKFYPNDVFKISEDANYCYKFRIVEDASTSPNSARIQEYKTFFDSFFLYVDQKNVRDLKESTERKFREMFHSNEEEFENYLKMISEWSMQKDKKEKLDKDWMQRAIAIHLLSSRTKPLSFVEVNENRKILRRAISNFDITVFEKNVYGAVSELWGDAKEELEDLEEINKIRIKYQLSSSSIENLDNADPKLLSQILWIMDRCPLIVTEDQTVYRAIKLCLLDVFVVLGIGLIEELQKHFSVFQDLSDLQRDSNVCKDIMKNFTCSLQGKEAMSVQALFTKEEEVLNFIKTDDLLEMLDGPCNVGGDKENLPKPYIERFLLRNVIDISYLEKVNEDCLIILDCKDTFEDVKRKLNHHNFTDIHDYLSRRHIEAYYLDEPLVNLRLNLETPIFGYSIYVSKDKCIYDEFQAFCNKNRCANCHQFRYRDDGNLDWIRSKNDVSDLENYKVFNDFVEEKILWSSQPDNNINIIIGDPGMGKTELMKSLKNNCCSGFWTIVVYPKDIYSYFKNLRISDHLVQAFEKFIMDDKYGCLKRLDKEIFKASIRNNTVMYIWDALDEISSEHLEMITNIILLLSERSLLQWITSRPHLQKFLETKFNVLSMTISQFNKNQRKFYIKERLVEESEQIINKIESSFTLVEHKDVLGIPLQIFMLTELFRQNKNKNLDLLDNVFALTDLYHYFIEEKANIYFEEKAALDPYNFQSKVSIKDLKLRMLEFALKALFSDEIRRLKINCEKELQSIQTINSALGIITEVTNDIPRFLHSSFAEYLVAFFFSKHLELEDILVDIIFQQKYVNIRFFFDLLLAKSSPAHIALLYKDFDFLKKCDKKILKHKDNGGRNVLHLACTWGQKYPLLNVEKSETNHLIDDANNFEAKAEAAEYLDVIGYLADECDILENDTLFNMTPLSYAQKSDCLFAQLKIVQKQKTKLSSSDSASINILYYSARFGYINALDLFTLENLPFIKTKKDAHCLLHLACEHNKYIAKLLETDFYKKKIDEKDNNGNTSLHLAAYNNFYETATILVENGAQIDVKSNNFWTPFLVACWAGHEKIVEILTSFGADINCVMNNGATPLFVACQKGHDKVAQILLKSGAGINFAKNDGTTPLLTASQIGDDRIVELLVESGADINLAKNNGVTPLLIACYNRQKKIVEILAKSGSDINLASNDAVTPLYLTSEEGYEDIVEILVKSGADINLPWYHDAIPLCAASYKGHDKIVGILTRCGANINRAMSSNGFTPLLYACDRGHKEIVNILIKYGVDLNLANNNGETPLLIACCSYEKEIVEILAAFGADTNLASNDAVTPLFHASQKGYEDIVEILLKFGADLNLAMKDGATPLSAACHNGHEKIVEVLVKFGADINIVMSDGMTPLFRISKNGNVNMVKILIKPGADINLATNGTTPLLIASYNGHEQIVELLIKFGAHINLANNNGITPLFGACQNGYRRTVEILVKSGADINAKLSDGLTPVLIASSNGHENIVEILIKSGADINLAINNGSTPLSVASYTGHEKIVELLVKSGANVNARLSNGLTPLLIACQNGHENIVEILIKSKHNNDGVTKLFVATEEDIVKPEDDINDLRDNDLRPEERYEDTVEVLTKSGADINLALPNGATPLFVACQHGHDKIVSNLLKARADIHLAMNNGITPLFVACHNGHDKIVEILIQSGGDINLAMNNGVTPLSIASQEGHEKIVELLILFGADVNLANNDGETPLLLACCSYEKKIVEILATSGADTNLASNDALTPLFHASQKGYEDIVEILVKSGADINARLSNGLTPLLIASSNSHENIVEILIKSGADINLAMNNGSTPLSVASGTGHEKIVEVLVKSGANINARLRNGLTPLLIACQNGHENIVEILIKPKHDISLSSGNDGVTLLFFAAEEDIVKILVKAEAGINHDDDDLRPLFLALEERYEDIVEVLTKSGAEINLALLDGATPLFVACQYGHDKIVANLLKARADINLAMNNGITPLFVACHNGHDKIVEILIKSGGDINLAMNNGTTPLSAASQEGHVKIVELLILFGADVNLARNDGTTPYHIALRNGHINIVHILTAAGTN